MSLKLDRLQRAVSLVDNQGVPSSQFQTFWQRTMEAIEGAVNNLTGILLRLGVVEVTADGALDLAQTVDADLAEVKQAPVLLQAPSGKFPSGYVLTTTPTITIGTIDSTITAAFSGDTDDVPEGGNLYFTNARARLALTNGTGISYTPETGTIAIADTAVTPGDYGSSSQVGTFTVDEQGRLIAAANVNITPTGIGGVPETRSISTGTGLVGGGNLTADRTLSLATSGVTAGSYGSAIKVPTITVDAYGRVTIASENTIPALASGTYTPTMTTVFGVATVTAYACQYLRVGNTVTVSGKFDVGPSAVGSTIFRMSLPIASAFTAAEQAGGTASTGYGAATEVAAIAAGPANLVEVFMEATDANVRTMWFSFTYRVL